MSAVRATFRALEVPNFRRFFFGQIVSVSGTWMQTVAQGWLVLQLTGSGAALGLVTATQFLPMLLLGPLAGVVADRVDRRRFLLATQSTAAALAATLAVLVATGRVELWMVFLLALGLGTVSAFDMPTRQAFVFQMVGPERLTNAVSLNSVVMNAGRLVGPAIGGVLITTVGLAACFGLNALSYGGALWALARIRRSELVPANPTRRAPGQLREGLRYVWGERALRVPLLLMAVVGTLAYEFQVTLPLLARDTFGTDADGYGFLLAAMSAGAVIGGLGFATRQVPSHRRLGMAGLLFGALVVLASVQPTFASMAVVLPFVGAASIAFITLSNSVLQLTADPAMRGRVIALYGVAFLGSTPIGAPIVGWIGEAAGPRWALGLGGIAALAATAWAWRELRSQPPLVAPGVEPEVPVATPTVKAA